MLKKNTTKLSSKSSDIFICLTTIIGVIMLMGLLAVVILSSPIADDLERLKLIPEMGIFGYIKFSYLYIDGRYSNAFLMATCIWIFKSYGLKLAILGIISSLIMGFTWIIYQLIGKESSPFKHRVAISLSMSVLISACLLYCMPSIFDTIAWFNACCIYLASIAFASIYIAYTLHIVKLKPKLSYYHFTLLVLGGIIAGGFNEPLSVILLGLYLLFIIASLLKRLPKDRIYALTISFVGIAIGLLVDYFSPGNAIRVDAVGKGSASILALVEHSLYSYKFILDILLSYKIFLLVIIVLIFLLIRQKYINSKKSTALTLIGLYLAIAPGFITGFIVNYCHATEGILVPNRTAVIIIIPTLIGISILIAELIYRICIIYSKSVKPFYYLAIIIAIGIISMLYITPRIVDITKAESLRNSLLSYREAYITAQRNILKSSTSSVAVVPAPIILEDSQAPDLIFLPENEQDERWVYKYIKWIYDIKGPMIIEYKQPPGYCLDNISVPWSGIKSCADQAIEQSK